jgi:predicted O-methyltransferase YrrM
MLERVSQASLGVSRVNGPFSLYLNQNETSILIALVGNVAPRVMIEFGCNMGITAKRVLDNVQSLERYIGIDVPEDHRPTLRCQDMETPDEPGLYAATDPRFWLMIAERDIEVYDLEPCDAVFIDGDHSEKAVTRDSRIARQLIRPGGMICWHDYDNPAVEVTQALHRLRDEGWEIKSVTGSWIAFMRT